MAITQTEDNMTQRYKVINGSQSCHCCFSYTVVDTEQIDEYLGAKGICESFNKETADKIAAALNWAMSEIRPIPGFTVQN